MNVRTLGTLAALSLLAACSGNNAANTGATSGTGAPLGASAGGSAAPGSEEDLVANVGDRVFFAYNENALSSDAQGTLDKQSAWLAKYPQVAVQIAGNTDDRGTEEYNLALGQRRANAARDYLVSRGVSQDRVNTISYGKDRPTALGDDEQAWAHYINAMSAFV